MGNLLQDVSVQNIGEKIGYSFYNIVATILLFYNCKFIALQDGIHHTLAHWQYRFPHKSPPSSRASSIQVVVCILAYSSALYIAYPSFHY